MLRQLVLRVCGPSVADFVNETRRGRPRLHWRLATSEFESVLAPATLPLDPRPVLRLLHLSQKTGKVVLDYPDPLEIIWPVAVLYESALSLTA